MKSAVLVDADWPGDQVVITFAPEEASLLRQDLQAVETGDIGGQVVAVIGRIPFRTLHRYLTNAVDRREGEHRKITRALLRRCDRLARELQALREGDRSGDPLPRSPLHAAMAENLAEAGR